MGIIKTLTPVVSSIIDSIANDNGLLPVTLHVVKFNQKFSPGKPIQDSFTKIVQTHAISFKKTKNRNKSGYGLETEGTIPNDFYSLKISPQLNIINQTDLAFVDAPDLELKVSGKVSYTDYSKAPLVDIVIDANVSVPLSFQDAVDLPLDNTAIIVGGFSKLNLNNIGDVTIHETGEIIVGGTSVLILHSEVEVQKEISAGAECSLILNTIGDVTNVVPGEIVVGGTSQLILDNQVTINGNCTIENSQLILNTIGDVTNVVPGEIVVGGTSQLILTSTGEITKEIVVGGTSQLILTSTGEITKEISVNGSSQLVLNTIGDVINTPAGEIVVGGTSALELANTVDIDYNLVLEPSILILTTEPIYTQYETQTGDVYESQFGDIYVRN